jgi:hypothetical protein
MLTVVTGASGHLGANLVIDQTIADTVAWFQSHGFFK